MVIYGCMSGKPPTWPWQSWILRGLRVQGFNFSAWVAKSASKVPKMMVALGKLMAGDQLKISFTEYAMLI